MPPAVLNLTTRLAAAGCRPALALLAAIHFAAFAICDLVRGGAGGASGLRSHLGAAQFHLAGFAAPPAHIGGALARCHRRPDPAVAVQARRSLDDGDFRRRDDHRPRQLLVPAVHHPGPCLEGRSCRRCWRFRCWPCSGGSSRSGYGAASPRAACLLCFVALCRAFIRGADRPGGRVPSASICFQVRTLGGGRRHRSDDARRVGGRRRFAGPLEPDDNGGLRCRREAAAYRHGVRRVRASTSP